MSLAHTLARPEVLALSPPRIDDADEASLVHATRLHANENPYACAEPPLQHYPDMYARTAEHALAALYGVAADQLLVSRGSDEGIDLLVRSFCVPGRDAVLVMPPTFGMYAHSAQVQGARLRVVPLLAPNFGVDQQGLERALLERPKLVFFCTPNNPTGTLIDPALVLRAAHALGPHGLVVVDEAYAEFCEQPSMLQQLASTPNLVVLRTMSKARGLAGARIGALMASPDIIGILRRVRPPYAIASPCIEACIEAATTRGQELAMRSTKAIVAERDRMFAALQRMPGVEHVWASSANFHLLRHARHEALVRSARDAGIALRAFPSEGTLAGCVRMTVGTPAQNDLLLRCMEHA